MPTPQDLDPALMPWQARATLACLQVSRLNAGGVIPLAGGVTAHDVAQVIVNAPWVDDGFAMLLDMGVCRVVDKGLHVPRPTGGQFSAPSTHDTNLRASMESALLKEHPAFYGYAFEDAIRRCVEGRADPQSGTCEPDEAAACVRGAIVDARKNVAHCRVMDIFKPANWPETQRRYLARDTGTPQVSITVTDARAVARYYLDARAQVQGTSADRVTPDFLQAVIRIGRRGYTVDDIKRVIDDRVDEAKHDPDQVRWLSWPVILKPENFARTLSMSNATEGQRKKKRERRERMTMAASGEVQVDRSPEPVSAAGDEAVPAELGDGEETPKDPRTVEEVLHNLASSSSMPEAWKRGRGQ